MAIPDQPSATESIHRANVLLRAGKPAEALQRLDLAIASSGATFAVYMLRGDALAAMLKHDEAAHAFRLALSLDPRSTDAALNLGMALARNLDLPGAMAAWRALLEVDEQDFRAHANLSNVHALSGQWDDAIRHARRALAIKPDQPELHNGLANIYSGLGRVDEALASLRHAIALNPLNQHARSSLLLNLHYSERVTPDEIFAEHVRWGDSVRTTLNLSPPTFANSREADRTLRVGYVSSDFREHSVAQFITPVLEGHDRERFDVFVYSGVPKEDDVTQRLRRAVPSWRSIKGIKHSQVADMIRADRIDILVDLAGHTAGNRQLVFARKPAPIQVTYLGYPDTTGLREMDYRLTDAISDPPGLTDRWHTEKLIRIRDSFLCYSPPVVAPAVAVLPALLRDDGALTFGSFNNFAKVSDFTVTLWADVLRAVPNARLLLKAHGLSDPANRQRTLERLAAHGIDALRVELRGATPTTAAHLAGYDHVDVALDTYPYHGTTTTCEALWMGVPTLTLTGLAHVSRVGTSIMTGIGLPQFAAETREQFVAQAVKLSANIERLGQMRREMRDRLSAAPLLDHSSFVRKIESAYRQMWVTWIADGNK